MMKRNSHLKLLYYLQVDLSFTSACVRVSGAVCGVCVCVL